MGQAASRQEAFWEACGFGHVARVKRYIEEGIDVNWVSYTHDCCPIHVASQGKPEVVSLLLEQNCNVNVLDIRGNTPLHHAAMKGHSEIMQTLISAGCKIDTEDKNGWTALHNAAYWCHYKAIKVLIKNKCDMTITNKDSRTALHEVARSKETEEITLGEIARLLIQAGSDINARGSDLGEADFTGLMFASYHGHYDVASAFVEAGCDLNACGASNNWSALHWAADRGQDELVYLLLEAGIDPTIKNYRAETAADRAKSPEVKEMIRNAINMFEEMKGLDLPVSNKPKSAANSQASPTKNKVSNQMLDNIFSKMPAVGNRPQPSSNPASAAGDASKQTDVKSHSGASNNPKNFERTNRKSVSEKTTNQKSEDSSPVAEGTNENSAFQSVIDKLSSEISEHTKISEKTDSSSSKVKDSESPSVKDSESPSVKDNESSSVKDSESPSVKDNESSKGKNADNSDSEDIDVKLPKFKTLSDIEKMKENTTSNVQKTETSEVKDEVSSEVKDIESSEVKDTKSSKVKDNSEEDHTNVTLPKLKKVSELDDVKEIITSNKVKDTESSEVKDSESSEVKDTDDSRFTELHAAGVLLGVMKVAAKNAVDSDDGDDDVAATGIKCDADDIKRSKVNNEEEADEVMEVAAVNLVNDDDDDYDGGN